MRIVIVGNGVAGMEAALTIKNREPSSDITIISEESDNFFSRTALMWVFTGQLSHQCIEPLERDVYERLGLKRVRARAVGVDTNARVVKMAGGLADIPFDQLLIACGSRPRPGPWPGSNLPGVGHFVTMQDLEWFEKEVLGKTGKSRPPRADKHLEATTDDSPYRPRALAASVKNKLSTSPAVIGGGLIGIEAVEVLHNAKLHPHFFIREEWFWPIAIEPREAQWITERMREQGVQVHLEHDVQTINASPEGAVQSVTTNHGNYDVDLVVISIGVVPNTDWLKGSDIELDRRGAILVDPSQKTNIDGIYSAGDCAAVRWFDGSQRPEQLWYTGRDQGRVAGKALLGDRVHYERGIWYNSAKLMDIEYTTAGLVNMKVEAEQNWFFEEKGSVKSTNRIVVRNDQVIGFNFLGRRWDHEVLIRWIAERRSLTYVLERLHEASFDTEFVPRLKIPSSVKNQPLGPEAPNPYVQGPTPYTFA